MHLGKVLPTENVHRISPQTIAELSPADVKPTFVNGILRYRLS
jgi:hypothetical protein